MATRGPQNGRRGLESGLPLGFWAVPSTFAKEVFEFDYSFYENLKNPKWPLGGLKMADGVWQVVRP